MKEKIIIRLANLYDLSEISKCNKRNLPLYYSLVEYFLLYEDSNNIIALAEYKGKIIGFIVGRYQKEEDFHILTFGIDEKYRRFGLGTKLMDFTSQQIKNSKNLTLNVHRANEKAINFYKKYGFKEIEILKNYYKGHLKDTWTQDAFLMSKSLKN
jgi:ribosomal-protein-alanine N-acetyltransferase